VRPKDYVIYSVCANCGFSFAFKEYDEGDLYYCTLNDKSERPRCGSVYMNEGFHNELSNNRVMKASIIKWDKWTKPREVLPWGCCPGYKPLDKSLKI